MSAVEYRHGDVVAGPGWELRCGDYREVLADVECDAVITDPPFGDRTHSGQRHGRWEARYTKDKGTLVLAHRGIGYERWTADDVAGLVSRFGGATWLCALTSHDLAPAYEAAQDEVGRYGYAPIACVQRARNVRLAGDGPSNWADWMMASRRRNVRHWGALPGAYVGPCHDPGQNALDRSKNAVPGAKPRWLMRAIVRDYSRRGDLICDPCAGGGTTLLAAVIEGRRAIGAELDPVTFGLAVKRLQGGYTPCLPGLVPA